MNSKFGRLLACALPFLLMSGVSLAATEAPASSVARSQGPEAPVPPTIADDQQGGPEPEVRIIQKGSEKIEEYRMNGKLYMVKVTPSVGVPYYLVDEDGSGKMRQVNPNRRIVIPQWVLLRF